MFLGEIGEQDGVETLVPQDLAAKIETIVDDPDLASQMGTVGTSRVRDKLAWEHSRAPLLAAYDAVAGRLPGSTSRW
ncbi:MAG: glycosyltransferase [Acidimicrobiales bacterium]